MRVWQYYDHKSHHARSPCEKDRPLHETTSRTKPKDGCHIASMDGTWMMLTDGLGGMRDDDGILSFWPHRAPEATLYFGSR
jgi:trehalose/maltose hydrolase-like predicted phosphorylase